ncbi:hypothetical protein MMC13_007986 [Lambiella insularis]|nr:hypothetical protein [Lambiella insularis]
MAAPQRQSVSEHSSSDEDKKQSKRQATLYDAVAGRVTSYGFGPNIAFSINYRDILASSASPLPPEEVLFRRKDAPKRFEEKDFYWADQKLTSDQSLPDSDLAKGLHMYASHFYNLSTTDRGEGDSKSLDETALLAMAILLQEISKHALGPSGHLVFVEGEEEDESSNFLKPGATTPTGVMSIRSTSFAAKKSGESRKGKKRKLDRTGRDASEE